MVNETFDGVKYRFTPTFREFVAYYDGIRKLWISTGDTEKDVDSQSRLIPVGHLIEEMSDGNIVDHGLASDYYVAQKNNWVYNESDWLADIRALTLKGQPNGVATLDNSGQVPSTQLPSYVDDVLEGYVDPSSIVLPDYTTTAFYKTRTGSAGNYTYSNPYPKETDKIYVDVEDGKTYRCTGTASSSKFILISKASDVLDDAMIATDDHSSLYTWSVQKLMTAFKSANPEFTGSINMGRKANTTKGNSSIAFGNNTTATNANSAAIGDQTSATGTSSMAVGYKTKATANYAFAEGQESTASGQASHAENKGTAAGQNSHAEGTAKAYGMNSHAEGNLSIAGDANDSTLGEAAHAEGSSSIASGKFSHAEGASTTASGWGAHAEGTGTTASANFAHAEGNSSSATALYAHAEGNSTIASGVASHAEGTSTTAAGNSQHVVGKFNVADPNDIYIEIVGNGIDDSNRSNARTLDWNGNEHLLGGLTIENELNRDRKANTNIGTGSFAFGKDVEASGNFSHAEGRDTIASNVQSHAEGGSTTASGHSAHSEGNGTTASGTHSHAEGSVTKATGECSHSEGDETVASGSISHAEGFLSNATGTVSHAEGQQTTASGSYSHSENLSTEASGYASHAEGVHTIAARKSQHTFGEYNVAEEGRTGTRGDYVEIVGNGSGINDRSNARALKWTGDEYLMGNVYVESQDSATGKKVATEDYVVEWMNYSPIAISAFTFNTPSSGLAETGSTVSSVKFNYTLNKDATNMKLDNTSTNNDAGTKSATGIITKTVSLTEDKTFTFYAQDTCPDGSHKDATKTAKLQFVNKVFYGAAAIPETINSTFIRSLTGVLDTDGIVSGKTITTGADEHMWYASPKAKGTRTFNVGGFDGGFQPAVEVNVKDAGNNDVAYYVYRSTNPNLGTKVVTVK